MTDEERKQLCDELCDRTIRIMPKRICEAAAGELERLAKENKSMRERLKYFDEQQIRFNNPQQEERQPMSMPEN